MYCGLQNVLGGFMSSTPKQGAVNAAIMTMQVLFFFLGAVSLFSQGMNVILLFFGITGVAAYGGYHYPATIDWMWHRLVEATRVGLRIKS